MTPFEAISLRTPLVPQIAVGVPDKARDLIWDCFFVEAGRGTQFKRHLPWCDDEGVCTVMLCKENHVTATAILRPALQPEVAMIGYVCVERTQRGQGHGRTLMYLLNMAVDDLGYRAAILWTSKPAVYLDQGYEAIVRDRSVRVTGTPQVVPMRVPATTHDWTEVGTIGLPAFATKVLCYRSKKARAVVAEGGRVATLLDWQGDPIDVAMLLMSLGCTDWYVNLDASDPLPAKLTTHGFHVIESEGAFTMVRRQDATFVPTYVRQLNRI